MGPWPRPSGNAEPGCAGSEQGLVGRIYAYANIGSVVRVSVAGASGYAGGELLRLLLAHPRIELGALAAGGKAGQRIIDVHPNLTPIADAPLVEMTLDALADADLTFLALPHGQSAALADQLPDDLRIVDLGADFRLADARSWEHYYGGVHAGTWAYGLPELPNARQQIFGARRIANPGCYATAVALAGSPMLAAGLVQASDIVVVAASGTSGAGRKPTDGLLATQVMGAMSAYKVGGVHQHIPEMEQALSQAAARQVTLSFTPLLAPMPRGIVATITAQAQPGATEDDLRGALRSAYDREPFVHLLPAGVWPQTSSVLGSNAAQLQVALDEHAGRAIVVCALDNLGKGAAGQALQNANLMLGFDEGLGLTSTGVAP